MKFKYQNRTGGFALLPEGDYKVEVAEFEVGVSNGPKTRGSDVFKLRVREELTGAMIDEQLIFHPASEWKVDCVLRAIGRAPSGAQEMELSEKTFIGGKARVHVVIESYPKNDGATGKSNKIAAWLSPETDQ